MTGKQEKLSVLVVEDERSTREGLQRLLRRKYDVTLAEDGKRALNLLKKNNYDLILSDLVMPEADGMEVIKSALKKIPKPQCIILTAYGSISTAVDAMREGAYDFVTKPVNLDQLELTVERALETRKITIENQDLKRRLDDKYGLGNMLGESAAMHEVIETIKQVAPAKTTVLISGESGTGKELAARGIHQLSGRRGRFVAVHCAALPANLLESELFGHEKGAFTGATEQKKGRFELADGGTLFLDEIGEIDPAIQVKILRALETRSFERVGGTESIKTDTRVLAASNRDLKAMMESGDFREDLFYRLYVVTINMPPLRDRKEDIPVMTRAFIKEFAEENDKQVDSITEEALDILTNYDWRGNVRELRNCVERMVVMSREKVLQVEHIPINIREAISPGTRENLIQGSSLNLAKHEKMLIIKALEACEGNKSRAAKKLGISRRTIHRKLEQYGLLDK